MLVLNDRALKIADIDIIDIITNYMFTKTVNVMRLCSFAKDEGKTYSIDDNLSEKNIVVEGSKIEYVT